MIENKKQLIFELISCEGCEGLRLKAYYDSKGIPTIGVGTIKYPNGNLVKIGDICTKEQAAEWMNDHLSRFVYPIVENLQNLYSFSYRIFAALCSLAYNIGSALQDESILAALKAKNQDMLDAAFRKYNKIKINGKFEICKGLMNRREIEIKFMKGI